MMRSPMRTSNDKVIFGKKELRGSRLRCLIFTSGSRKQVAHRLTTLIEPYAEVDESRDQWMPRGFLEPDEAKLGDDSIFLSVDQRRKVTDWWLAVKEGANTPNWDIVSTCTVQGRNGLVLVEAKAHVTELSVDGKRDPKTANGEKNDCQIVKAVADADKKLNAVLPGFSLSTNSHYQLCNRFAWACKIVSLGMPVILVYLGFLSAEDMADRGQPFRTADEWSKALLGHGRGIVPDDAWNQRLEIDGTPMWPLIRAVYLRWEALSFVDRSAT